MGHTKGAKNILSHLRKSETLSQLRSSSPLSPKSQGHHHKRSWDNPIKTNLSIANLTCFGKDTFSLSYSINLRLPHSCLSPLYTLAPSHDSRHRQTVFVAGLSLWRTGVNWMVTALPARRVVWCSVCIESRLEFFPPLSLSPSVFDENQTDLAEVWASTEVGRLSAHRYCHANSGTAWDRWDYVLPGRDVTSPRGFCCLQRDAWSLFSTITYQNDTEETMNEWRAKIRERSHQLWHICSAKFFLLFFSVQFYSLLTGPT